LFAQGIPHTLSVGIYIPSFNKEALMSRLLTHVRRSTLPILIVLCLAALTVSYAFADEAQRPLATTVIGDPDAAVTGKLAVGTATPGNKALTVVGVIDFLGAGTVHNYFTQGAGNNMQINTNVDEANTIGDTSKSQWKLVMGSSLDWFSIRRSPAGATYNEDALFFIDGSTGNVGIATVDTGNLATIPFTPPSRLYVEAASGDAIQGIIMATSGSGVTGYGLATTGITIGVAGVSASTDGRGIYGWASAASGSTYGVYGWSQSTSGHGVFGAATATSGQNYGVSGQSNSTSGGGVYGVAPATTGVNYGVVGESRSTSGRGVWALASATSGVNYGVYGTTYSTSGYGVYSQGDMRVAGDFSATGTKAAIIDTKDYGWRSLYAMESPQNWFEDFGQAVLTGDEAVVSIEPVFAQTVNLDKPYHVFLTPRGDCGLYVAEQTAASFTVRALNGATCEIAFDYRIIAPRLDYEDLRLKEAEDPAAAAAGIPEVK
jgi:hypothetical protein